MTNPFTACWVTHLPLLYEKKKLNFGNKDWL